MDNNFNNQNNMSTVQPGVMQPGMPMNGMPQPIAPQPETPKVDATAIVQPEAPQADTIATNQPQENVTPAQSDVTQPINQSPMGQPPMGMAPMGQPPMGQPPMGMAPIGQPPMGQPPMGQMPMGQMPMGQMPMGQMPMGMAQQQAGNGKKQKAPKVKKPLTNGKIAAIIGGSVALVAAIVCAIIFIPKLFKPAKDVVVEAFENTFTVSAESEEKQTYMQEVIGIDEMNETFISNGGEIGMSIALESLYGEVAPYIMSIGLSEKVDYVNQLANLAITFDVDGTNVATVNAISDETNTYFEIQDFIEGYFSLPNENTFIALENSPLGQELGLYGMPEGDMNFFATTSSTTELNADYVTAVETLWDSVIVEKEGKAKIDVNGEKIKATEYIVTIEKEKLQDALISIVDATLTDDYIAEYATMYGMSVEEVETTFSTVKSLIPSLISEDFVAKVYIKDDKVVKMTSEGEVTLLGVSLGYDFFLDIDDETVTGEFVMDVMGEELKIALDIKDMNTAPTGSFVMEAGGEVIGIDFAYSDEITDSNESMKLDMSMYYNSEDIMDINMVMDIDKTSDTFDGSFGMYMSDEYLDMDGMGDIELVFEGSFTDINKGVSYKQVFDNIECIVAGESVIGMSATYTYNAGSVSVADVDGSLPVYDLTTMTSDDLTEVIDSNEELITNWSDNAINNTGAFGEDISSMMEDEDDYYEDDYYEDDYYEDDYSDDSISYDNAILYGYDANIQLTGCIDGFNLEYISSLWIDLVTANESYATYYIYEDYTIEEVLAFASLPSEENGDTIYASTQNQAVTISDGSTVYYSYAQYDYYGYTVSMYTMAKEVAPGVILNADAYIYDDYDAYTLEQVAEMLNDQYFILTTN